MTKEQSIRNLLRFLYNCEFEGDLSSMIQLWQDSMEDAGITNMTLEQYVFSKELPRALKMRRIDKEIKNMILHGDA